MLITGKDFLLFVCESALKRSDFLIKYVKRQFDLEIVDKIHNYEISQYIVIIKNGYRSESDIHKKTPQVSLILSPQLASTGERGHKSFFPNIYYK